MRRVIIIIGHGSRSAESTAQFRDLVRQFAQTVPDDEVLDAYLEITAPSLPDAMAKAAHRGAGMILIIPCLLFAGVHVLRDIPTLIDGFKADHPGITVVLGRAIGADPLLVEILRTRVAEIE